MTRINEITILVGRRGTGKTTLMRNILKANKKKALIVDTFDHPSWSDCDIVPISNLKYWKKGNYRVKLKDLTVVLVCTAILNKLVFIKNFQSQNLTSY